MASPLGLSWNQRFWARWRVRRGALLGVRNRAAISYTQGPRRWDYINRKLRSHKGQYPHYADCSSYSTGLLWDATRAYGLGDFVNGLNWRAGYTGTQIKHGQPVPLNRLLRGDLVFYGYGPSHVAIYVGNGKVVSHGGESGPLLLPLRYRAIHSARRYIR